MCGAIFVALGGRETFSRIIKSDRVNFVFESFWCSWSRRSLTKKVLMSRAPFVLLYLLVRKLMPRLHICTMLHVWDEEGMRFCFTDASKKRRILSVWNRKIERCENCLCFQLSNTGNIACVSICDLFYSSSFVIMCNYTLIKRLLLLHARLSLKWAIDISIFSAHCFFFVLFIFQIVAVRSFCSLEPVRWKALDRFYDRAERACDFEALGNRIIPQSPLNPLKRGESVYNMQSDSMLMRVKIFMLIEKFKTPNNEWKSS